MPYRSLLIENILLLRWGIPAIEDADALFKEASAAATKLKKLLLIIMIMPSEIPAPSDEVRDAMGRRANALLEHASAIHCVIEGTGFKNAIKRSVTTGVLALTGKRGKMIVHKDFTEALLAISHQLEAMHITPTRLTMQATLKGILNPVERPGASP